jgi:hypothetical protein
MRSGSRLPRKRLQYRKHRETSRRDNVQRSDNVPLTSIILRSAHLTNIDFQTIGSQRTHTCIFPFSTMHTHGQSLAHKMDLVYHEPFLTSRIPFSLINVHTVPYEVRYLRHQQFLITDIYWNHWYRFIELPRLFKQVSLLFFNIFSY